jgi:hypothetical protein
MKKLATFVFALLLGASLSFAQAGTPAGQGSDTKGGGAPASGEKTTNTKKKGSKKKGKKSSKKGTETPTPK